MPLSSAPLLKVIFRDGTSWVLSQGLGQKLPLQQCFCAAEAQGARTKPPLPAPGLLVCQFPLHSDGPYFT